MIWYGFPVVRDFSPLTIGRDHAHALFALHAASSRSAHPTGGLVAANAATGVRITSAMIVFLTFSSCSNRIVMLQVGPGGRVSRVYVDMPTDLLVRCKPSDLDERAALVA